MIDIEEPKRKMSKIGSFESPLLYSLVFLFPMNSTGLDCMTFQLNLNEVASLIPFVFII